LKDEIFRRHAVSIGDTLAEARSQAGLTVTQVSQQTRIRESIIRSIELDDYSPCGGDFYARGHIRSIADTVGTDPVPLVREYDEEHGPVGDMRAAQIFEPAAPIKIREPRRLHLGKVLAVVLLAVIGFGVYRLVSSGGEPKAAAAPSTARKIVAAKPKPKPSAKPKTAATAAPKDQAVIKLTAVSNCWVGLDSATGQSLYEGIVAAGQTVTWDEKNPVSLVIGNPPGVELTVNGKTQQTNTVQVLTLSINPNSKTPVTVS
jgi:cytoskeletal protein RodZ